MTWLVENWLCAKPLLCVLLIHHFIAPRCCEVRAIIIPNVRLKEVRQASNPKLLYTVPFDNKPEGPLWLRARALEEVTPLSLLVG